MGAMQRPGSLAPGRDSWGAPRRTPSTRRGPDVRRKSGAALGTTAAPLLRWPRYVTTLLPRHPEREEPTALCLVGECAAGVPAPVATVARCATGASTTGTAGEGE
jgi:hypothetical protein